MSLGQRVELFCPAAKAHGREGINKVIPPDEDLVFDVELLEIRQRYHNEESIINSDKKQG